MMEYINFTTGQALFKALCKHSNKKILLANIYSTMTNNK